MNINTINKIESKCKINLDWYYHSTPYERNVYRNILKDGIKCNDLLNRNWCGRFNGPFYISLSKITIPENICFLNYACSSNPSFVIEGITPIKCTQITEYERYVDTKDKRRIGNLSGEYQYYLWIKSHYIKAIVYDLARYLLRSQGRLKETYIEDLLELIRMLEELNLNIPIYDYSRRDKMLAHEIDKEKLKYYRKDLL